MAVGRAARVALDHVVPDLDGTANSISDASEFNEDAISRPLNDAPVMHGDRGVD
jgi:hypothetical protein